MLCVLSKYFTKVLDIVSHHHGDVVKFCGDCLMVIWPIDPADRAEVKSATIFKASKCAVHLIQDCRQVTGSSSDAVADIKIQCGIS